MHPPLTRRHFLASSAAATGLALAPSLVRAAATSAPFSFVLLGDLHYDQLAHHDFAWTT